MRFALYLASAFAVIALALIRAADPPPVEAVREAYFDMLQRIAPREATTLPVRVVDIDEASLAVLGQWPWPRDRLATLTERLTELGVAVVAYDVLFAEPDRLSPANLAHDPWLLREIDAGARATLLSRDNDRLFAQALENGYTVLSTAARADGPPPAAARAGVVAIGEDPTARLFPLHGATPIVPDLRAAALGIGVLNVSPAGVDGIVRRVPLVWQGPSGPVPGLAIEALRVALDETTLQLHGADGAGGLAHIRLSDFTVPTNDEGEMRVHYRPFDPDMFVSAAEVLASPIDPELIDRLEGHVVFVGTSAAGLLDIRATPLGETVPGVSIHAQIVEQILSGRYLRRSDLFGGAEILALVATGAIVAVVMGTGGALASILAGGAAGLLIVAASIYAFLQHGVLFDATFPVLGGFAAFSLIAMFQYVVADRDKRRMRASFAHYVSEDVLSEIEARGHSLELGGEIRDVTVLFSDIRGFTGLSERMEPGELVALLNRLFGVLSDSILRESGTIDKYIGDAIMAFWNAPIPVPDHATKACAAALGMRRATVAFNEDRASRGMDTVEVMIGLAAGPACVGNLGSPARYNYSVVGETVNRAARIEASCRHVEFDILVGAEIAMVVQEYALLPAGRLALKGVSDRTATFVLLGDGDLARSSAFRELSAAHAGLLQALAENTATEADLKVCRDLARRSGVDLERFYRRLPERRSDFIE